MAARKDGKGRVLRKGEHYRKSDGRYSYEYRDPYGKRKFIYSINLMKLREREEQLIKDQLDGLDIYVAGRADLNYLFDRYISTKTELQSTTYSNYVYTWDHFIRDGFGKRKIGEIKYSDVLQFYTYLIKEKGLQINTLEVLLATGCRIGEIIGLRWEDVDFENRMIDINHSLTYYARREDSYVCEFRVSLPKTESGIRCIPMMEPVYQVLIQEYERQQEEGFCEEVVDGMTNFVFTNRFGGPHNPAPINRVLKRIVDAYNSEEQVKVKKEKREAVILPKISCHIFRHTFASRLCENETNIKVIQEVMGHADVSTTMNIYAEVNKDTTRESLDNLAKKLDVF